MATSNPRRPATTAGTKPTVPDTTAIPPRLGMVMRFNPGSAAAGVRQLESGGFRVASSGDFRVARAIPNNFDGADVQYFERFGIAIVRSDGQRLQPMLRQALSQKVVSAARPERSYRAAGLPSQPLTEAMRALSSAPAEGEGAWSRDFLRGWREATNQLVDRLLAADDGAEGPPAFAAGWADESTNTWGLQATRVVASSLTGAGVRVAVLDTGFDDAHPDFAGRSVTRKLFASHSVDADVVGHGTHCVGTACGPLRPAGVPRYGVAHEAEILAGKVLGDDGFGTDRSIIAGMEWALDQGCAVISMSLAAAAQVGDQPSDDYEHIGRVCLDAGALVVAAASNDSRRPTFIAPVGSPANASTIMAVAALDHRLRVASFSCGGVNPGQDVDLAAPGVDILSCLPGGGHARWDGTSMATPHVAGIAALLAQSDARFRGWALWARLLQLSRRLRLPVRDVGRGLVQAPVA